MFRQMYEEKYMRFPNGVSKAVTLSYDDGVNADKKLVEILNRYGLNCTFNLNSSLFGCSDWHGKMNERETYSTFNCSGHEIALHGARHIFLNKVPLPEAVNEMVQNRLYLEKKFDRIVRGMAYAYNGYNCEIIRMLESLGVAYARTTDSTHGFTLPENWLTWNPTCHHNDDKFTALTDEFLKRSPEAERKHREPMLFYVWGHSYEFDDDGNWDVIENFAKRVSGRSDVWYATNGEIYDYVTAYGRLIFSMDGERVYNPTHRPLWIELREKVYKIESGHSIKFEEDNC